MVLSPSPPKLRRSGRKPKPRVRLSPEQTHKKKRTKKKTTTSSGLQTPKQAKRGMPLTVAPKKSNRTIAARVSKSASKPRVSQSASKPHVPPKVPFIVKKKRSVANLSPKRTALAAKTLKANPEQKKVGSRGDCIHLTNMSYSDSAPFDLLKHLLWYIPSGLLGTIYMAYFAVCVLAQNPELGECSDAVPLIFEELSDRSYLRGIDKMESKAAIAMGIWMFDNQVVDGEGVFDPSTIDNGEFEEFTEVFDVDQFEEFEKQYKTETAERQSAVTIHPALAELLSNMENNAQRNFDAHQRNFDAIQRNFDAINAQRKTDKKVICLLIKGQQKHSKEIGTLKKQQAAVSNKQAAISDKQAATDQQVSAIKSNQTTFHAKYTMEIGKVRADQNKLTKRCDTFALYARTNAKMPPDHFQDAEATESSSDTDESYGDFDLSAFAGDGSFSDSSDDESIDALVTKFSRLTLTPTDRIGTSSSEPSEKKRHRRMTISPTDTP